MAVAAFLTIAAGIGTFMWQSGGLVAPGGGEAAKDADSAAAAAGFDTKDKAAIEAIVRAYILENPEIIPEAVQKLQGKQAAKRIASVRGGKNLVIFPEGTRNMGDDPLLPFKSGLFHLATQRPEVDLVPVWIDNLNRVLPKGAMVPIPLICTVTFGAALRLAAGEEKTAFLRRAETALLALAPQGQARIAPTPTPSIARSAEEMRDE